MQGNFLKGIVKASSPFLILVGFLSFIVLGVLVSDYYANLFNLRFGGFAGLVMGISISLIVEGGRFGFLLASIRDFAIDNKKNGWLGLIASLFLVIHDLTVAWKVALLWSVTNHLDYFNCFVFLILFGLAVEIRLVMAYSKMTYSPNSSEVKENEARPSAGVSSRESAAAGASDS